MHTDPTNAARVRPEQTDAKTLTRSQNEYESITFEQCCEQVPKEAAVEAEVKSMPACSMATVTRAANLQDGRRGGLNTVLRAPAVVPALGLVHAVECYR